jgi:hypothetical protein
MLQDSIGHVIADCGAHTLDGVDWAHCEKDAAYIVHAANSYPRLVEALKELLKDCDADLKPMGLHPARVLLRSLGESE